MSLLKKWVWLKKKLIPKTIGNKKQDCAWGCARRINTTSENLQIEKHKSGVRYAHRTDLCFSICRFSEVVFIPRAQPHAQSLFLFPLVYGINLIHVFDEKKDGAAGNSIVCFGASIPCHAIWQKQTKNANCFEERNVFGNGKCELSALQEGRN